MNTSTKSAWTAEQGAAILLLCRLFVFFCSDAPYTAAYAKGMLTAVILQTALILPLLKYKHLLQLPSAVRWAYRIYALLWAAQLTAYFYDLCSGLQFAHPVGLLCMLGAVLLYTAACPQNTDGRAGVLLLTVGCFAFLLLPVSGIRSANPVSLYMPDNAAAAFLREWRLSGELPLIPLIWMRQDRDTAVRSTGIWAAGRGIFLPLLVLFGTMQNGRLLRWEGNPFFLLLARTPLSDAIRTDGFWMLFALGCGVLCITFALQSAKPQLQHAYQSLTAVFVPYLLLSVIAVRVPQTAQVTGIAAAALGIAVPWGCAVYQAYNLQRLKRRKTA